MIDLCAPRRVSRSTVGVRSSARAHGEWRSRLLWQEGTLHALGTLGGRSSNAVAINDRGQVVGNSDTRAKDRNGRSSHPVPLAERLDARSRHARRWVHPAAIAVDINERGQVVGSSWNPTSTYGQLGGGQHTFLLAERPDARPRHARPQPADERGRRDQRPWLDHRQQPCRRRLAPVPLAQRQDDRPRRAPWRKPQRGRRRQQPRPGDRGQRSPARTGCHAPSSGRTVG